MSGKSTALTLFQVAYHLGLRVLEDPTKKTYNSIFLLHIKCLNSTKPDCKTWIDDIKSHHAVFSTHSSSNFGKIFALEDVSFHKRMHLCHNGSTFGLSENLKTFTK